MSELVKRFKLEVVDAIVNGIAWEGSKKGLGLDSRKPVGIAVPGQFPQVSGRKEGR